MERRLDATHALGLADTVCAQREALLELRPKAKELKMLRVELASKRPNIWVIAEELFTFSESLKRRCQKQQLLRLLVR